MSKERIVYMNGEYIPESQSKISIYDSALMFGDMVFEMTRSFNKKHFKLKEHIQRLYYGLKRLEIPIEMTMEEMEEICWKVSELNEPLFNEDDEHRLVIDVTRGVLPIYKGIEGMHQGINIIIADFPLRWTISSMAKYFDVGINAVIPSQRNIPARYLDPKIKNRSRIHYLMANLETSKVKGDNNWALMLDDNGFVTEGTGSNFFIVKNGVVMTPEGRNVLRGISRDYIFELCEELNIGCVEKNIEPYDVVTADEAFMTGTPFCILPVVSINGQTIGDENPITNCLLMKWSKNVGVDIIQQMRDYSK